LGSGEKGGEREPAQAVRYAPSTCFARA